MAKVRVVVVDDSGFFRRRIRDLLDSDPRIEVVGDAANGREAVEVVARLRPDVVTMDIEMPEMDGISAVREIMRRSPTPILMFSSLTYEGANATLEALDAGAVDFLPKRFSDISGDAEEAKRALQERVYAVGARGVTRRAPATPPPPRPAPRTSPSSQGATARAAPEPAATAPPARPAAGGAVPDVAPGRFRLVVIGTSTGGPVALQTVISKLPANFPVPILLIQHMPGSFTPAFAKRLDQMSAISVREAEDGEVLHPGTALLAPGGRQLGLKRNGASLCARVFDAPPEQFYKPSVDVAFTEAARSMPGKVLGVVLTGMGSDGAQGAKLLKDTGSAIWAQDEASSVIYGMPAAVARAGLAEHVLGLDSVAPALSRIR